MKDGRNLFKVDKKNPDKKQLFIDATICSLANFGYKRTTVRRIADFAGVTPGLLTHYFTGKEELIAESYKYFSNLFLEDFKTKIVPMDTDPINALKVYIESTFAPDDVDPKYLRVWLAFWAVTLSEQDLRMAHKEIYQQYIDAIESILKAAYTKHNYSLTGRDTRSLAIGIYALLDGLWLECCLDPEGFSQRKSLETAYQFIESSTGLIINGR
ncbi:MAG: TetR family transcriptional regulator C-terminal domain-containing protein [Alphaproteobacteria bacterium]|nr:TetR family transcriptional regulator C-terminal domain-containing protein [Alphaproteobacteria bacterium]HPF45591.1 TetR family transcriptional regulator C-terminal domain-containing protein [Emcibacteraceae bacterium]HRW29784.1 TetR family transcriptional regulator C-terminal domain-containing protein [Emcibacteraceae bacterium]